MNNPALQKILLVEDEDDIRSIAKLALEKIGHFTVGYCSSGKEALQVAEGFAPDLMLLDMMMPGMDGIQTFHALKQIPALKDVPVVFMTAKVQKHEVDQYLKLGAIGVIPKPFNAITLASELTQLWSAQHEHQPG